MKGPSRSSQVCPYVPGEDASERHQRRMDTAVDMTDVARRELDERGLSLVTHAGGSHWQVKDGRRIVAQWWPQSGRFVHGENYGRARKCHDVHQMLEALAWTIEREQ